MRLLVSIASRPEIASALKGGAQVLDVKDPAAGSLGAANPRLVGAARAAAPPALAVSAALGDRLPTDARGLERTARLGRELGCRGASFLKIGLAGLPPARAGEALEELLQRLGTAGSVAVVAVAFADDPTAGAVSPEQLPELARAAGAAGAMLDTLGKEQPILAVMGDPRLREWARSVRIHGLLSGIAGALALADLSPAAGLGADVVGVRGAVCEGGRGGRLTEPLVRLARAALDAGAGAG